MLDRAHAIERKIHSIGGKFPRRCSRFTQAGGEKTVVDLITLAAEFLKTAAGHADMPLLEKKIAVLNLTGFFAHVKLHRIGRLNFPLRIINGYLALGLHVLGGAIEAHLISFERRCLALDLHIPARFNLVRAVSRFQFIRRQIDFAGRRAAGRTADLSGAD